ncbi:hypothetical protein NEOC95_001060 [Neochlamydia sp. AcF95]|nr:hypothetical protein [Neochlamydia sp. AcF95]
MPKEKDAPKFTRSYEKIMTRGSRRGIQEVFLLAPPPIALSEAMEEIFIL